MRTINQIMNSILDFFRRHLSRWPRPDEATRKLLQSLAKTEEQEISCDDVFAVLDQLVEAVRRGENVLRLMPLVHQHLEMCPDCREEYDTLMRMMQPA